MKHIFEGVVVAVLVLSLQAQAAPKGNPMDADKDGKVSKKEFCAGREKAAEKAGKEFNKAQVEKQFAARDKNKDGFLTAEELVKAPKKAKPAPKNDDE